MRFTGRRTDVTILLAISALLIAWRFLGVGGAPFIMDEPVLQSMLDLRFSEHRFPLLGLFGTYGLRYGPTAMWFYLPLRLLTANAEAVVLWHATSYLAAFAFYYAATRRAVGACGAAWSLLLAVSSPLLFIYSRIAWDNTLFTLLSALILHELVRLHARATAGRFALLGLWCGLALNLHPMALPLVLAAFFTGLAEAPSRRNAAASLGPVLLLLLLYALGLKIFYDDWPARAFPVRLPGGGAWHSFRGAVAGLMQFFTPAALHALFPSDDSSFTASLPAVLRFLFGAGGAWVSGLLGWALLAAAWACNRPLTRFAVGSVALSVAFYLAVRPEPIRAHYFTPYWWIAFYSLAIAMEKLSRAGRRSLGAAVAALAAANCVFLGSLTGYLRTNDGTRDTSYGTSLAELRRITGELCDTMKGHSAVLQLEHVPGVTMASITYLAAHAPECQDRRIYFPGYESPMIQAPRYELRYRDRSPEDAGLRILPSGG